jgi:hypothetical protein
MSRSRDDGASWDPPRQIAPGGSNPNAGTLGNGIIVVTYARPGSWLVFSEDGGTTWVTPTRLSNSDAYTDLVQTGYDKFLAFYFNKGAVEAHSYSARRVGEARAAATRLEAVPAVVAPGESGLLTWFGVNVHHCVLTGGAWGPGTNVSGDGWGSTGAIDVTTQFHLRCESIADTFVRPESEQTIVVR